MTCQRPRTPRPPALILAALSISLVFLSGCPSQVPKGAQPSKPLTIRGYVAVRTIARELKVDLPEQIYVPGLTVFARKLDSDKPIQKVTTDLSGRFNLNALGPGEYVVCWDGKGYRSGCRDEPVILDKQPVHLSTLVINSETKRPLVALGGRVSFSNGASTRTLKPAAGVNSFAVVTLVDADGKTLDTVPVNNFDQYFLPLVPGDQPITLIATIGNAKREFPIDPQANLIGASLHRIDLTVRNYPPRLAALVPLTASGTRQRAFAPGDVIHLRAQVSDRDGDTTRLRWKAEAGTVSAFDAPEVKWQLPAQPGRYGIELVVADDKGGHASASLDIDAHGRGVRFSGHVGATDVADLAGAAIEVNGVRAVSDDSGTFSLYAADADRYVLTIRKPGYAFVSRIYDGAVRAGRWTLLKAEQFTVDLNEPIDVTVQERPPSTCRGRASDRIDWRRFAALIDKPQYQDGKGQAIGPFGTVPGRKPPGKKSTGKRGDRDPSKGPVLLPAASKDGKAPKQRECGPGPRVRIPAKAMVDAAGTIATGNATLSIATVDLNTPEQMPGDYTVDTGGGSTGVMRSYGAIFVSVEQGSTPLNLANDQQAILTVPVDPSQLAAPGTPEPTIPTLHYDETEGVWRQTGIGTLTASGYETKVDHFSAINMDLVRQDQACVRVQSAALPGTYRLEVTVPLDAGAAPKVKDILVDQSTVTEHVVYNLPTDTNLTLVPYDDATDTPYGIFVVNTGAQQNPTSPNRPTGPTYDACSTEVVLQPLTVPPVATAFLQGLESYEALNITELDPSNLNATADNCGSATQLVADSCQASANYYETIDPCGKRTNFAGFRAANDLDSGATQLVYANAVDLGFGRDMNCKQTGADVGCYVTNYGNAASNDPTDDQQDANDAAAQNTPFATVAMEYSPIETACDDPDTAANEEVLDSEPTVKFYTYNADGNKLLNAADLDGEGLRAIPQLCMVCHGGLIPNALPAPPGSIAGTPIFDDLADVKLGSRFLPFDAAAYVYPSTDAALSKANQQAAMQALNNMVNATEPANSSLDELISAWYNNGASATQIEDVVVSGWDAEPAQEDAYREVIGKVCRTCHIASAFPTLEFKDHIEARNVLNQIESRVCEEGSMPHAERTHEVFWTSVNPSMVARLQAYGDQYGAGTGWLGNKCGVYTEGGDTPVTAFSGVQELFDGTADSGTTTCTLCHAGGSPAGALNLAAPDTQARIVNTPSAMDGVSINIVNGAGGSPAVTNSFLWHFIHGFGLAGGTQGYDTSAPGAESQMAPSGQPSASAKSVIEDWIEDGAAP